MVVKNQNFTLRQGQTKIVDVTLTDEETGAALTITNQEIIWQVLTNRQSSTPVLQLSLSQGIEVKSASNGTIRITMSAARTERFDPDHYYHILWIRTPNGTETPAMEGRLEVIESGPGV